MHIHDDNVAAPEEQVDPDDGACAATPKLVELDAVPTTDAENGGVARPGSAPIVRSISSRAPAPGSFLRFDNVRRSWIRR
jgi:hypothetical protein